ncbi:tetratricopeptide repeat protein [Asanoa ferruginea]|uniref:Tetratricopeptide repeat protein n=1 Tax=Asanoa ferruginea TaxID=53367 RepID=A0A3D9ZUN1_9ACTN|nr:tetratricopeptide repeat protein [Asanoa ferruginea]REG00878.1 tetratricopeptide repeat protein [Asanoa ferruginea]
MRHTWLKAGTVVVVAVALTTAAAVLWGPWRSAGPTGTPAAQSQASALAALVTRTEERLARVPDDWQGWADLGMAHVQLARITADPGHYGPAEEALRHSLSIRGEDRNGPALTGFAALEAARHDFAGAERYARKAVGVDPYAADAYGALADALIELGRPEDGFAAVQKMVDLRPDTGSYARASYTYELRGDLPRALDLMRQAREVATEPGDITFTLTHLASLAALTGDPAAAATYVAEGLARQPGSAPLLAGRAHLAAGRGDTAGAAADLRAALDTLPTPEYATALGDLLTSTGDVAGAKQAYDVTRAVGSTNQPDVDVVLFWADNGEAARAVTAAKQLYTTRKSTVVADALGWALHRAGRSAEALPHADDALRLGTRDARGHFHRGMIRLALGDRKGARADIAEALRIDPHFNPLGAETARTSLAALDAR